MWSSIDFCVVDAVFRERLTDLHLSKLLTSVNAREATTNLDLSGCQQIRGSGLAPLRNSRILGTITLLDTAVKDNPTPVQWILRTMFSYNLFVVRVDGGGRSNPDERIVAFLRNLRDVKAQQAQENRTLCSTCNSPVLEPSRNIVPTFSGARSMQCFQCDQHFCRRANCPTDVKECQHCGECSCQDCGGRFKCHYCGLTHCFICRDMSWCDECNNYCCKDCSRIYNGEDELCGDCGKTPAVCTNECFLCTTCCELGTCVLHVTFNFVLIVSMIPT